MSDLTDAGAMDRYLAACSVVSQGEADVRSDGWRKRPSRSRRIFTSSSTMGLDDDGSSLSPTTVSAVAFLGWFKGQLALPCWVMPHGVPFGDAGDLELHAAALRGVGARSSARRSNGGDIAKRRRASSLGRAAPIERAFVLDFRAAWSIFGFRKSVPIQFSESEGLILGMNR